MIPATAGIPLKTPANPEPAGKLEKTFVHGFVLFPRVGLRSNLKFFAIRIQYRTLNIRGLFTGTIRARPIEIPADFTGYRGHCYICGTFNGNLDRYI